MIYAKNPLKGNYTGYLYNIPAKKRFDYEDFLAKNALPGPGSNVHCILEADKDESKRQDLWMAKRARLSQIPGFFYKNRSITAIPRPAGWLDKVMTDEQVQKT